MPSPSHRIWVSTRKGAFCFTSSDRKRWKCAAPQFAGQEVHQVVHDPRDPDRAFAIVGTSWFGYHLQRSLDGGKTWAQSEEGLTMPDGSLKKLWHVEPGHADEPNAVYLGADPGALFRSGDGGTTWEIVNGLTNHATREKWQPGAGGMMVHSIQCLGKGRLIVGISAAGAFRSADGGATWEPHNGGVLADFQPDKFPEVGQCVHRLLAHPKDPETLYQQNHCGVYRGKFAGKKWTDLSKGLPSRFGFCLAVPAAEPTTLFTIPTVSGFERFVPEGKLRVARSRDAGKTWELLTNGLPQENAYVLVLRGAMASDACDEAGVYFGTSTGTVYATRDAGDAWKVLAANLPPVHSVTAG